MSKETGGGCIPTNTEPSLDARHASIALEHQPHAMGTPTNGDDRLSELPDCVLTDNVLSRLTSLQAVRTSVLSRRWRHLWRAVPCVDIDQREFRTSKAIASDNDEKRRLSAEESEAFEDLGDMLLPLLDAPPPLDTLRLHVSFRDFRSTGRRFTRRGLARRPVEFHLRCDNYNDGVSYADIKDRFPYFPGLTLPRHLGAFACRLRTMRLAGLSLEDDFADCLAADFPVLEDLRLEGCMYCFRRLASQSLRTLVIDISCFRGYIDNDVLAIAAPRIASLRIDARPPPVTVVCEMPDLVAAASLTTPSGGELSLLRSLRHARRLGLSKLSTTALLGGVDFPVFGNLRTLLLYRCDIGVECQVLRCFLRNAPSLEALTLRYCSCSVGYSTSRKRKAMSGEKTSDHHDFWCSRTACQCSNLRSIEVEFDEGCGIDELAQALLRVAKEEPRAVDSSVENWDDKCRVKISFK
ncbi:unnamed protein product [Urochloa decumbens]|uniref:F-box domain-containing protein n=1 Tax=Urochloa decumbens TaxID=240449 RepID=A0ABC9F469_9POAL